METQNELKDRIISFMRSEGISSGILADRIGVQRSSISHLLSGRNKPSYDFILKFLETFPNLNAEWLISGKGNMYKEPVQPNLFKTEKEPEKPDHNQEETLDKTQHLVSGEKAFNTKQETDNTGMPVKINGERGHIKKIIIFYDSGNFEEFIPA